LIKSGEIALAVVGAINCFYIEPDVTQTLTTKFWHELLEPWFQRYSELLTKAGFHCRFVDHTVYFQDLKCNCGFEECNEFAEFGFGILCINTNNLTPHDVNQIDAFFAKENKEWELKPLYADFVLWTPHLADLRSTPEEEEDPGGSLEAVAFNFHYPDAILGSSVKVCCTKCFEFGPLHRNKAVVVGDLFWQCYSLIKEVGITLRFGLSPLGGTSPDETARAYLAAAGNNIALLNRWNAKDLLTWYVDEEAKKEVMQTANQLG